jgi:hypothetical protein
MYINIMCSVNTYNLDQPLCAQVSIIFSKSRKVPLLDLNTVIAKRLSCCNQYCYRYINKIGNVRINMTLSCARLTTVVVQKQEVFNVMIVFVVLVIQHVTHMRHIVLSTMAFPSVPHYLINGKNFGKKKVIVQKMCVLFSLQILSPILKRIQRGTIINVHKFSC